MVRQSRGVPDPLEPERLRNRFRLFEIAALPSVMGQTNQDFAWLLIVDPALGVADRRRLEVLIEPRRRSYLHAYDPGEDLEGTAWLAPYLASEPDYLITTNLDDDDALPNAFVAELQEGVRRLATEGAPVIFAGARQSIEWDLLLTPDTPYGFVAPWHRRGNAGRRVSSCGFSLACRHPDYPFSVRGMSHVLAAHHLDFAAPPHRPVIKRIRRRLLAAAASAGDDLEAFSVESTFLDTSATAGPALMTNHLGNLEATRVLARKDARPVAGPETFPGFTLGWDALARYESEFRLTRRLRLRRVLWRARRGTRRWYRRSRLGRWAGAAQRFASRR